MLGPMQMALGELGRCRPTGYGKDALAWAREAEDRGAGEVMVTAIG